MFIDDINKHYLYLNDMRNVVWEQANPFPAEAKDNVTLHAPLDRLFNMLWKERPTWKFKSTAKFYTHTQRASNFHVYEDNEHIGSIWVENHWRDHLPRIYFDSDKLRRERGSRGRVPHTGKVNDAAKRIVKMFHLKSPGERAVEMVNTIHKLKEEVGNELSWPLRRAETSIREDLMAYAVSHWDTVKPFLKAAAGIDMPTLRADADKAERLRDAYARGHGICLRVEPNGSYFTCPLLGTGVSSVVPTTYSENTFPEKYRTPLGLLKMVDVGTYVDGIGMRATPNTYFIIDKEA